MKKCNSNVFVVIRWNKELSELPNFEENSHLIHESKLSEEYSDYSYFVRVEWLIQQKYDR